jgi:hypothetical protein
VERTRQSEALHNSRLAMVERGIKAGDLRQVRPGRGDHLDGCQIVRLMQRRQRLQTLEPRENVRLHPHRRTELGAPVHDPVPDRLHPLAVQQLHAGFQNGMRRGLVAKALGRPASLQHRFAGMVFDGQARLQADPLDLAAEPGRPGVDVVNGELDAGRAGVEDGDRSGHGVIRRQCSPLHPHRRCRR